MNDREVLFAICLFKPQLCCSLEPWDLAGVSLQPLQGALSAVCVPQAQQAAVPLDSLKAC